MAAPMNVPTPGEAALAFLVFHFEDADENVAKLMADLAVSFLEARRKLYDPVMSYELEARWTFRPDWRRERPSEVREQVRSALRIFLREQVATRNTVAHESLEVEESPTDDGETVAFKIRLRLF